MIRARFKQPVYTVEHIPSGLCLQLSQAKQESKDPTGPAFTTPGLATHFLRRIDAEEALACLGPAPLEIVRVDA